MQCKRGIKKNLIQVSNVDNSNGSVSGSIGCCFIIAFKLFITFGPASHI